MMSVMGRVHFVAAAVAAMSAMVAQGATWTNKVVNTPDTAYEWADVRNWQDNHVPDAYEKIVMPSAKVYVSLAEGVVSSNFTGASAIILGSKLRISGNDSKGRSSCSATANAGVIFADLEVGSDGAKEPWISNVIIAGRIIGDAMHYIVAGGTVAHRLDWYAYSSNPVRTDDVQIPANKMFFPGSGHPTVWAPQGAQACSSTWAQTENSPFLTRVGNAHPIAVGTIVTGNGIPEGTFVRRKFSDSSIELSAAATSTIPENALSFAAFTPDVRIHVNAFQRQGTGLTRFKLYKYREEDGLRFEMDEMRWYDKQIDNLGLNSTEAYHSGTYVFHTVYSPGGQYPAVILDNVDIELAGTADGGATVFNERIGVSVPDAACTVRMTVTNNIEGAVNTFTNFNGTLVKEGAGTLTVAFGEASNKGTLRVAEGTFVLAAKASAGEGAIALGGLSVAAGATLVLPACGVKVPANACSIEAGAVISGEGRLVVTGGAADNYVHDPGEGEVAGHPMFWLDASKTNTMTLAYEGDDIYLTRWNDCREGEPMFCTNMIRRPRLVWGDAMTNRYVKLTRITNTCLHTNTEALVWSVPVGGIKAVFLVQDPTDGGGEILGRTMRLPHDKYYGSQGGPYYRDWGGEGWNRALISPNFATPCIKNGRFFINGQEVVGYEKGYLGKYMQLVENHMNTNYAANANHKELWLDAIGVNYLDGHSYGTGCNGAMRIAECIIYTNTLTHAERVKTAQYLSRKWLGKDIEYSDTDGALACPVFAPNGSAMDVVAEETAAFGTVEGGGGLVKTGAGRLVVDSLAAGAVSVEGGELLVKSFSVSNTAVAAGAWLHVDAADASTLTTYSQNGTNFVSAWNSLTANGQKVVRYSSVADKDAFIRPNATNGLPMVDLGPALKGNPSKANSCVLQIQKADGTTYSHSNDYDLYLSSPYLRTMFIMHSSSGGGGALLGAYSQGYPFYSFPHDYTRADSAVLSIPKADTDAGYSGVMKALSNTYVNATHVWHWNGGTEFNPFTQPFTGGCDLLSWRCSDGANARKAADFAIYGQGRTAAGGLAYGEVLMYERILAMDEFNAVEAYLLKKWLNKDTPGFRVANVGSLLVASGATMTLGDYAPVRGKDAYVSGGGHVDARFVGGGGTVNGNVKLLSGGGLTAVVGEDGTVAELTVNGVADLTAGGEVTFAGEVAKLLPGNYALLTAAPLLSGGTWMCASPSRSLSTSVRVVGDSVMLNVSATGTTLILR